MRLLLITCVVIISAISSAQESDAERTSASEADRTPACNVNEVFNGRACKCAPGYFMYSDKESRLRCEDECEEVYHTFFTYGACVNDIFGRLARDIQPDCNLRCGVKIRTLASIGIFMTFAAALTTLIFTLPLCIATCTSCLNARKANKTAKRVFTEAQNQPSKEQQLQTLSYNPYVYWPYYGRA